MSDLFTKTKPIKLTSTDIRNGMSKRWAEPEYAIMWEVADATGSGSRRYADAVIMSLWPSRGLELHGVEIKVSRSDWKREAADPRKAESVAQYCDRWWIHTAPGVVDDLSDLPPQWGLREFDGRSWKTIREAEKNSPVPISRGFLASILRRADGAMRLLVNEATKEARARVEEEIERNRQRYKDELERAVQNRTAALEAGRKNIELFATAFGVDPANAWKDDFVRLGRAAKALSECNVTGYGHKPLAQRLRAAADEIDAIDAMLAPCGNNVDNTP